MQIHIDTSIDDAGIMHRVGLFLVNLTAPLVAAKAAAVPTGTDAAPAPVAAPIPPAPDFAPSDSLPPTPVSEDSRAAAVFGAAPVVPVPPVPLAVPPIATDAVAIPAASATPQAPVAPVAVGDVDSAGVPWDANFHTANKAKKQDGTWKAKKGLTGAVAVPVPPVAVPVPPVVVPVPPVPPVSLPSVAPVQPATVPTGTDAVSFRAVMQKMNAAIAAAKITKADTDVMLTQIGLKADELAPLVMPANAMLLAAFNQLLDAKLAT